MKFEGKHYAILGALAVTVGLHLQGIHSWPELLTPGSIGELVFQVGTVVGALLVGSPLDTGKGDVINPARFVKDQADPAGR